MKSIFFFPLPLLFSSFHLLLVTWLQGSLAVFSWLSVFCLLISQAIQAKVHLLIKVEIFSGLQLVRTFSVQTRLNQFHTSWAIALLLFVVLLFLLWGSLSVWYWQNAQSLVYQIALIEDERPLCRYGSCQKLIHALRDLQLIWWFQNVWVVWIYRTILRLWNWEQLFLTWVDLHIQYHHFS